MPRAENVLFRSNASWDLSDLPAYVQALPPVSGDRNHLSALNTCGTAKLNGFITKAILNLAKGPDSDICVINIGENAYSSERKNSEGNYTIAYANDKGELNASTVNGKRYTPVPELGIPSNDFDTTSILILYLMILSKCGDASVAGTVQGLIETAKESYSKTREVDVGTLYLLNDYLQEALNSGKIKCIIQNGGIDPLTKSRVTSGALGGEIICGKSDILKPGAAASGSPGKVHTVGEARKQFESYAATRTWTTEQAARIRDFPDDYIVPDEVIEMAEWFIDSRGSKIPANNLCWRGVTGCGKSTGAALLSCILHTPLYIMTCYTNMETNDFLSSLVPASRPDAAANLPTVDDIVMDPEYAYEQLTGTHVDGVTSQDALEKYGEACAAQNGKGTYYKRVKSEYIQALEIGAIVEIQEFSRIRDSGVLVGLNEHDHAGALIPLIDGSYIRRHENAITLWTDNVGYGSCRPVDPSVMRRMSMVIDTFELDKDKVVRRAMYNTDNALAENVVEAMYEVWKAIRDYCVREDITEGDLSPSDLENWIARISKVGLDNALGTCRKCLISKTTTDCETQERIESGVAVPAIDKWLEGM